MDFSNMFKKGGNTLKKKPVLGSNKNIGNSNQSTPNWLLEIPAKLDIEIGDLHQRKVFDQRRWHCVVKSPDQKPVNRIIAGIASSWNYLYSQTGNGNKEALRFKTI